MAEILKELPKDFKLLEVPNSAMATEPSTQVIEQPNTKEILTELPKDFKVLEPTKVETQPQPTIMQEKPVPTIMDYETPSNTAVGKDSDYLDSIAKFGKDFVDNAIGTFTNVPKVGEIALNRAKAYGAGAGELVEDYILDPIVKAVSGKELTYYNSLTDKIDKETEALNTKYDTGILKATDLADLGGGFLTGGLRTGLAIESAIQGVQQESGDKISSGVTTMATGLGISSLVSKIVDRYSGTDRMLRKLIKVGNIDDASANTHYSNYAKVLGKSKDDLTITDKVNALVQGHKNLDSILVESASKDISTQNILNDYYKNITNKIENTLTSNNYEKNIVNIRTMNKAIKEGYNNFERNLDTLGVAVPKVDEEIKSIIINNSKNLKLDSSAYSERLSRLINDEATIGDFYSIGRQVTKTMSALDRRGTNPELTKEKDYLTNYFKDTFEDTLKSNKLENVAQARNILDSLYTSKMNADKKNLVKIFLDPNVKQQDYKTVYQAMASTEDESSFDSLINLLGDKSKASANMEKFVIERLVSKNKDDYDIVNLGKLMSKLDEVHFRTDEGKAVQQVITDYKNAFNNMQSLTKLRNENPNLGGAKVDPVSQAQAMTVVRAVSKLMDYLPTSYSRKSYVVKNLPKYLEKGEIPKGLTPKEQQGMIYYKNMLDNSNYLVAEELNNLALKSKELETFKQQYRQSNLLGNQQSFTASQKGNVSPNITEESSALVKEADNLTKSPTATSVNSNVNEPQAPTRELVDTTVEPSSTNVKNTSNTDDIIDVEINPSTMQVITPDGHILDMDTLMKGKNLPDSQVLPEKVATPVKNFFDTKLKIEEDKNIQAIKKEMAKATTDKAKNKARERYIQLIQYQFFRDRGMTPEDARKAIDTMKGLAPLGIAGAYLGIDGEIKVDTETFLESIQ